MTQESPARRARALGFWMCTALVIGNTIGMGIWTLPAALSPYGLNATLGWLVTLIGFVFIARVFAGFARAFPEDDGPYAYTQRAFGEGTAFMVLWCYWVSTWITNATIAIGVVGYLTVLIPALKSHALLPPVTALGLVWFFVLLNMRGVRLVGGTQVLTTILKLLPLVAVILLGIWELVTDPSAYSAHPPPTPIDLHTVIVASTVAIFAMLGIESASVPAGRVMDPQRTIPRATMAGTIITALIYLGISTIPILLIPQGELSASGAPFADLFSRFLGGGYGQILAIFVIISGLGALNGWTLVVGEVTQDFSKRGNFPRALAKENRYNAPARAFVLTGAVASLMLLTNYTDNVVGIFTFLSLVVTAANLPLYLVCSLAVLTLWRRGEIAQPGGRATGLFFAAIFATCYCIWAFVGVATKEGNQALFWALALAAVGAVVYLLSWLGRRARRAAVPGSAA